MNQQDEAQKQGSIFQKATEEYIQNNLKNNYN